MPHFGPGTSVLTCESTSSPRSIRRRSTAGPECTSPSWSRPFVSRWTCRCAHSARRATRRARPRTACRPNSPTANGAIQTLGTDLEIVADVAGADVVHSHTWYANFAGHLASLLHGIPHIVTAHSLEPLRPWKAEQLGGGYAVSSYIEKTAYEGAAAIVAVSDGMRNDILRSYPTLDPDKVRVIYNGIDVDAWQPGRGSRAARRARHRRRRSPRSSSSAASPGRRACRTSCAPPSDCPPTCRSSCAPARPTRRRSWPRSRGSCAGCRRRGRASCGSTGCCRVTSCARCSPRPRRSCARRSTSRSGSSTSRRWRAAPPSSEPRPAASRRSSSTA